MNLHPSHAVAAYEFLRAMPPMVAWGLPHADGVTFITNLDGLHFGKYEHGPTNGHHVIKCSAKNIGHTDTLLKVMAHEMVHLRQLLAGTDGPRNVQHNREFLLLARRVCTVHGWDWRAF